MKVKRSSAGMVLLAMTLAVFFCLTGMASAYPLVDLAEDHVSFRQDLGIRATGIGDVTAQAGIYNLIRRAPSGSGNPFYLVEGFCVEMAYSTKTAMQYEEVPIQLKGPNLKAVAWMLDHVDTAFAAETQVAAWEASTDPFSTTPLVNLFTGDFQLQPGGGGFNATQLQKVADIYLAAFDAVNNHGYNGSGFVWANSPPGSISAEFPQGYVYGNPVPIPATAWLVGSGLIGLVGLRRKRKA
jgi:hypothetical protein